MVETSSTRRWGCCRSSGRRRSEAGARIPRVGGRCRNVARAITTHRFGLWHLVQLGEGCRRLIVNNLFPSTCELVSVKVPIRS
jgi:hypothetical protein